MKSKKFEQIIAESPYKDYFAKVTKDELDSLWAAIEVNILPKVPISAYRSVRERGFAVALHGIGSKANLYVLLDDWKAWKSRPGNDTLATLMPKVAEIENYLSQNAKKK